MLLKQFFINIFFTVTSCSVKMPKKNLKSTHCFHETQTVSEKEETMEKSSIEILNDDCLIKIFSYLTAAKRLKIERGMFQETTYDFRFNNNIYKLRYCDSSL